tara:strand:+ start:2060 stop:2458 length:399 start_codon:yes stop_codon:yes gene_type:complete
LRCAVWFSNYGLPQSSFKFPYSAQSPISGKKVTYESEKRIYEEVGELLRQREGKSYSIGQSLYYQLPFFCNPGDFISQWCWDMITDYFSVKKFNIPLGKDLDSVNPWMLDCFSVIENEINNITLHERDKNGT